MNLLASQSSSSSSMSVERPILPGVHELFPEYFRPPPKTGPHRTAPVGSTLAAIHSGAPRAARPAHSLPSLRLRASDRRYPVASTSDSDPEADIALEEEDEYESAESVGTSSPASPPLSHPGPAAGVTRSGSPAPHIGVDASPRPADANPHSPRPKRRRPASGGRKHACPICAKEFHRPSALKVHLTTHTGEAPHTCTQCGRSFNVQSNLRRHVRAHAVGSDAPPSNAAVSVLHLRAPHTEFSPG